MRRFLIISLLSGLGLIAGLPARAEDLQVQEAAPDRYTVVKGDTLWDISGRFLKQPWRWPEIWRLNKEQIKNPHWIYPGDVITLDRNAHPPRLSVEHKGAGADQGGGQQGSLQDGGPNGRSGRLSPNIRVEPHEQAIPSVPLRDVQAFMGHPLVVDAGELDSLPKVVAFDGNRNYAATGDVAFAQGALPAGVTVFQVFHPGPAMKDPVTGEVLAYRADYVGDVRLSEIGDISRFTVIKGDREVAIGDRLMVPENTAEMNFVPHPPGKEVSGFVISTTDDHTMAARHEVVVVSLGARDGIQPGTILSVYPASREVSIRNEQTLPLPQTRSGLLFVFRAFDRVSYALVVQSQRTLNVPDLVRNP
jgi:hypothetical protein